MSLLTSQLRKYPKPFITEGELETLLDGSPNSRYSKVKRLLKQGNLLHLRRGLYCLTETLGYPVNPHPFELAQHIYAPSYISLESALSYHRLIPEGVYSITSVCTGRSKEFHTPLGDFSYSHLPTESFYTEVELIKEDNYRFFIAKPWKAICDYIYCYKIETDNAAALFKSLRINNEDLPTLSKEAEKKLDEYYHHRRLTRFLKTIRN